jgi:hypothetical protein
VWVFLSLLAFVRDGLILPAHLRISFQQLEPPSSILLSMYSPNLWHDQLFSTLPRAATNPSRSFRNMYKFCGGVVGVSYDKKRSEITRQEGTRVGRYTNENESAQVWEWKCKATAKSEAVACRVVVVYAPPSWSRMPLRKKRRL